jgi:hypothetical protein
MLRQGGEAYPRSTTSNSGQSVNMAASAPAPAAVAQLDTSNQQTTQHPASETHPQPTPSAPDGLVLHVDFKWSKFHSIISEESGQNRTPRYIQHFRPSKPQLRFNSADDSTQIGSGAYSQISISGDCMVNGRAIELKPLKRSKHTRPDNLDCGQWTQDLGLCMPG